MRPRYPHEELVVQGLTAPLSLGGLHDYYEFDVMDNAKAQQLTLEMLRYLVGQGFYVIGTPATVGFHQWLMPVEEAIEEISPAYIEHFSDRDGWAEAITLYLTTKGRELGRTLYR
jgi:hypothetical protein